MNIFATEVPPIVLFFGTVASAALVGLIFSNLRWALAVFGIMVFASTVSHSVDTYTEEILSTRFSFIQDNRNLLFVFGGMLGYLALGVHIGKLNRNTFHVTGLFICAIVVYAAIVRIINGFVSEGLLSIALVVAATLPYMLLLPNLLERREHVITMTRVILGIMIVWLAMNAIQFVSDPSVLYPSASGRFQGLTANPQFAAVLLAFSIVFTTWVFLHDPSKLVRLVGLGVASALAICLAWSGSRTGFLMSLVGLGFVFSSRIGQFIIAAPFAGVFGFLALSFVSGGDTVIDIGRLTSTDDTRTETWLKQINVFLSNPLFGSGDPNSAGGSESSYLLSVAAFGVFMGLIVFAFAAASALLIYKIYVARKTEDKLGKAMSDLAMGGLAMYFVGGLTEGFIMARLHAAPVFVAIAGVIGLRVLSTRSEQDFSTDERHYASDDEHQYDASPDERAYLPESYDNPDENVWEPEEDWQSAHERVSY
ncbi:MAG: O-antigen ligase family protein [Planctomycetota bacterium]